MLCPREKVCGCLSEFEKANSPVNYSLRSCESELGLGCVRFLSEYQRATVHIWSSKKNSATKRQCINMSIPNMFSDSTTYTDSHELWGGEEDTYGKSISCNDDNIFFTHFCLPRLLCVVGRVWHSLPGLFINEGRANEILERQTSLVISRVN